jgi:hypothetical protein
MVPEVCRIFCATANPVEVVVAETDQGRGVLGVIDGIPAGGGRGGGGRCLAEKPAATVRLQTVSMELPRAYRFRVAPAESK